MGSGSVSTSAALIQAIADNSWVPAVRLAGSSNAWPCEPCCISIALLCNGAVPDKPALVALAAVRLVPYRTSRCSWRCTS